MSRRLHREMQVEGKEMARHRDDESYPVMTRWDVIGWIDTEGNFTTARFGARRRATAIDLIGKYSREFRKAHVKVMRYGRMYGAVAGRILP